MQRTNERFVERLPLVMQRRWYAYALTIFFCLTALAARLTAEGFLPIGYPFISFFPAVILSTFLFGIRPGIFAGVLCGLISWGVFMPPRLSFALNASVVLALCFYAVVVAIDIALIHFMQRANFNLAVERERNAVLAENRELLFHELQHRVSNNLQMVAGLLALQRRQIDHDIARRALDDASSRLALVGRISRALYDSSGVGKDIGAFLETLTADVLHATGREDIHLLVQAPAGLSVPADVAVPLALIVAEAVSNAIEHGLPDEGGSINVTLEKNGDALALRITDDGKGIDPAFDLSDNQNLGLRIAGALAMQLGGRFDLQPGESAGAVAMLDLPVRIH